MQRREEEVGESENECVCEREREREGRRGQKLRRGVECTNDKCVCVYVCVCVCRYDESKSKYLNSKECFRLSVERQKKAGSSIPQKEKEKLGPLSLYYTLTHSHTHAPSHAYI